MLLVIGAAGPFGGWLAEHLRADGREVRQADASPAQDDARLMELVKGVDKVILITNCFGSGVADDDTDEQWLDTATRGSYDLLCAASAAGVSRLVVVSCLDIFERYSADLALDQNFRPRPSCAPSQLGPHLTEFVAREFASVGVAGLRVTVVRLGKLGDTLGEAEREAVAALSEVVCESEKIEQGRRSNGAFFLPPAERARFTTVHLPIGDCSRAAATVPPPSPLPDAAPRKVLVVGGGGILGPPVVKELESDFTLRVTDVSADKRNPNSTPLRLPVGHE